MALPEKRAGIFGRFDVLSFLASLVEKVVTNWQAIASYLAGGAGMSLLAKLQELPPLAWGLAFFGGLILMAIFRAIRSWAGVRTAQKRLYERAAETKHPFNRIEPEFSRQKINIVDLIHPIGEPLARKGFTDCEFYGPGFLVLSDCDSEMTRQRWSVLSSSS